MKKIILCLALVFVTTFASFAQLSSSQINSKEYSHWSIAVGNSLTYYRVHPFTRAMDKGFWHYYFDEMGSLLNPSFSIEYTFNPLFGLGLHAGYYDFTREEGVRTGPWTQRTGYYYEGRTLDVTLYISGNIANMVWPCRTGFWAKMNVYGDVGAGADWYHGFFPFHNGWGEPVHGNHAYTEYGHFAETAANIKKNAIGYKYGGYGPLFSFNLNPEYNLGRNLALGLGFGYRFYLKDEMGGQEAANMGMTSESKEPFNSDGWNITLSLRLKFATKKHPSVRDIVLCDYAAQQAENDKQNQLTPEVLKRIENATATADNLGDHANQLGENIDAYKQESEKPNSRPAIITNGYNWLKDKGTQKNPWKIKGVNFVFDKTKLIDKSNPDLKAVLIILIAHYDEWSELKIDGHTDSFGTAEYNQQLGMHRAEAIRDFFIANGLSDKKFVLESFGKTKPLVSNTTANGKDDPEGRQENRRVELYIIK
ncbi:MAG: OmpA family protein [Paludibacter sp.]|jgi:outer membrane protein OmpA-like peptidoglycan-associated protein|nr:OmpA family protein [Paludibacter sp.]